MPKKPTGKKPATKKPRLTLAALNRKVDDNENAVQQHRCWANDQAKRIDNLNVAAGYQATDIKTLHSGQLNLSARIDDLCQKKASTGEVQQLKEQLHRLDQVVEAAGLNKPPAGSIAERLYAMDKLLDTEKRHRLEDFKRWAQRTEEQHAELARRLDAAEAYIAARQDRKLPTVGEVLADFASMRGEPLPPVYVPPGESSIRGERGKAVERVRNGPHSYVLIIPNDKMAALDDGESFQMPGPYANVTVSWFAGIQSWRIDVDPPTAPEPPAAPQASADADTASESPQAAGASEAGQTRPQPWDSRREYFYGDCVLYLDDKIYRCLRSCAGAHPNESPASWELVGARESTEPKPPAYDPVGWNPVGVSPIQPGRDARRFVVCYDPTNPDNYKMVPVIAATLSEILSDDEETPITHWREEPAPPQ